MSQPSTSPPKMTFEEFIEFERTSEEKHEFWDGVPVAMAGAREAHNLVAGNVFTGIHPALNVGNPCQPYGSDQMVRQPDPVRGVYPDVSAVCGDRDFEPDSKGANRVLLNPCLIVEVLSESTRHLDLGEKMEGYLLIPSLQEYVVIDPTKCRVQIVRRTDSGWSLDFVSDPDGTLELRSVGVSLPMSFIYRDVKFDSPKDAGPTP